MQNIGMTDRIVRFILGIVFVILGLLYNPWWFVLAAIAIITGIIGWCGLYTVCKINTAEAPAPAKPVKKASKAKKKR